MKTKRNHQLKSASSTTWLSVFHVACWAGCVTLGGVAVWFKTQKTPGWENSFIGDFGVPIWVSTPFAISAILGIRATKKNFYAPIRDLFGFTTISLFCSLALFIFSSIAAAKESELESQPKRLILSAILISFSSIEIITCLISCASCYNVIGCFSKYKYLTNPNRLKGGNRLSQIYPPETQNEGSGHVTVMALPPRQAAELFYTMYRPLFKQQPIPLHSHDVLNDSFFSAQRDYDPGRRSRQSRGHFQQQVLPQTLHDQQDNYYATDLVDGMNMLDEFSENEADYFTKRGGRRRHRQPTPFGNHGDEREITPLPPARPYSQTRLVPVFEQDQENSDKNSNQERTQSNQDTNQVNEVQLPSSLIQNK